MEKESVQVVTLDEFIVEQSAPVPTHIKVDIDGSEMDFMLGAKETLASSALKRLIFELNTQDKLFGKIVKMLKDNGFIERSRHRIEKNLFNFVYSK